MKSSDENSGNMEINLDTMMKGRGKSWMPLSEDNWEKEMDRIPLFMNSDPTAEDIENNAELQAIQSLAFEGDSSEIANNFKNQGNELFLTKDRSKFEDAMQFYSRALQQRCPDHLLNATCLNNRAAINLQLKNFRSVILDGRDALIECNRADMKAKSQLAKANDEFEESYIQSTPDQIRLKALYRSAKACIMLDKFEEATQCMDLAKEIDPEALNPLIPMLEKQRAFCEEQQSKKNARNAAKVEKENEFLNELMKRSIRLPSKNFCNSSLYDLPALTLSSRLFSRPEQIIRKPSLNKSMEGNCSIVWPVVLIYPEIETFDYLEFCDENSRVIDILSQVLEDREEFNRRGYSVNSSAIYVPVMSKNSNKSKWQRVQALTSLMRLNLVPGYDMPEDGQLRLWVVPSLESKNGSWTKNWLKSSI